MNFWRRNSRTLSYYDGGDNTSITDTSSLTSTRSSRGSIGVVALSAVGVPPELALVLVDLVWRGVEIVRKKTVRLKKRAADRLTRFLFGQEEPPMRVDMTIVITGVAQENLFSADVDMAHNEGTIVSTHSLNANIRKLIVGTLGVTVRDLGHFTMGGASPYCMLIGLDAVFALVRQHWTYETFSEYSVEHESVTIVKLKSRHNPRCIMRLVWDNWGDPNRSQALVLDDGEWESSRYRSNARTHHDLTDVRVLIRNHGRILAFL